MAAHSPPDWEQPLHTNDLSFSPAELMVRDCFEALFDDLGLLNHYICIELLYFDGVAMPLQYHAGLTKAHWTAVNPFLNDYGYKGASTNISSLFSCR